MAELAESDAVPTPPESHAPPGHASVSCPNCRTATPDAFCSHCGQRNLDLRLSLRELISEAAEEALGVDSRIVNTLRPFFLRPGRLTRDYLDGKRARYTSPLKLYLVASAIFFLVVAIRGEPLQVTIGPSPGAQVGFQLPERTEAEQLKQQMQRSGWLGARLLRNLDKLQSATPEQRQELLGRLTSDITSSSAKAMFVLVPLFALLLKLFFRGRFYVEHLVFALHLHALWFALHTVPHAVQVTWLRGLATAASVVYVFLAVRTVYGESGLRTGLKLGAILVVYFALIGLTWSAAALAWLFTL